MAARAVWKGELKLALVHCPVSLHNAIGAGGGDIHFHMVNPETGNRVAMVTVDPEAGEVDRSALVRGYEVSRGRYVLFDKEELETVQPEATRRLEIERFVDAGAIDRIYWDHPYYLSPDGREAARPFAVLLKAIEGSGQIGIGHFVMRNREHYCALEPRGDKLLVTTLRTEEEVRSLRTATGESIRLPKAPKPMLEIAGQIIAQQTGTFNPKLFHDRYEKALADLIRRKRRGEDLMPAQTPPDDNVVDLLDALKASLGKGARTTRHTRRVGVNSRRSGHARPRRKRA